MSLGLYVSMGPDSVGASNMYLLYVDCHLRPDADQNLPRAQRPVRVGVVPTTPRSLERAKESGER